MSVNFGNEVAREWSVGLGTNNDTVQPGSVSMGERERRS